MSLRDFVKVVAIFQFEHIFNRLLRYLFSTAIELTFLVMTFNNEIRNNDCGKLNEIPAFTRMIKQFRNQTYRLLLLKTECPVLDNLTNVYNLDWQYYLLWHKQTIHH